MHIFCVKKISVKNQCECYQVTTVELCDLPGSSLSTLSKCSQLCCGILDNCNLVSVDDLNTCNQLTLLDVKVSAYYISFVYSQLREIGQWYCSYGIDWCMWCRTMP